MHFQFVQAGEVGEAAFADDLAEVVEIAFVGVFGACGGVEFALQAVGGDLAVDDVAFFEIGHDGPVGQGGDAAFAGDELDDGDGQFAAAARWVDAFG